MPKYVKKVYKRLVKTSKRYDEDLIKVNALKTAFQQAVEQDKINLEESYRLAKIEFDNTYYNTFRLIGGLAVYPNLKQVSQTLLEKYRLIRKLAKLKRKIHLFEVKKRLHAATYFKEEDTIKERIKDIETDALRIEERLTTMRQEVMTHPKFATYESYLDKGIDLASLRNNETRKLRDDLQIIFQDPYSSLDPRMTVGDIVGEAIEIHKLMEKKEKNERVGDIIGEGLLIHHVFKSKRSPGYKSYVLDIMEKCGLDAEYINRYPHQFSGGQRQRVGIARALALQPKFVVCDEAVSALDVSIQSQIINLLQSLKENFDLTYLFITHDLGVVKHISDRIGVMYFGNLVELAPADEIFNNPKHPYTKQLLNAIPSLEGEDNKQTAWDITYEEKAYTFMYKDEGKVDKDWVEVSKDHFVSCTLKTKNK